MGFVEMSLLVTIFIAFMLGYIVTGLVGFGGNVLILPLLSLMDYPVHDIVVVMAFVSFVNALYRVVECHKAVEWGRLIKTVVSNHSWGIFRRMAVKKSSGRCS